MDVPEDRRYTDQHEWALMEEAGVRLGITDYAQEALGEVVFVGLPEVGRRVRAGETVAEIDSTKSVAEVYAPLDGVVARGQRGPGRASRTGQLRPVRRGLVRAPGGRRPRRPRRPARRRRPTAPWSGSAARIAAPAAARPLDLRVEGSGAGGLPCPPWTPATSPARGAAGTPAEPETDATLTYDPVDEARRIRAREAAAGIPGLRGLRPGRHRRARCSGAHWHLARGDARGRAQHRGHGLPRRHHRLPPPRRLPRRGRPPAASRTSGSTNGTYVNGKLAEEAELSPGDEVIIGRFHLVVARGA